MPLSHLCSRSFGDERNRCDAGATAGTVSQLADITSLFASVRRARVSTMQLLLLQIVYPTKPCARSITLANPLVLAPVAIHDYSRSAKRFQNCTPFALETARFTSCNKSLLVAGRGHLLIKSIDT